MNTLAVETMTTEEKIQIMESIWDDLCNNVKNPSITSPSWHQQVLSQRKESINSGKDSFIDWNTAKKQITKQIQ